MSSAPSGNRDQGQPGYVTRLAASYGQPSQAGFGSAVFFEHLPDVGGLDDLALAKYEHFVGELWDRFGEAAWMGPWRAVYNRPGPLKHDIVSELRSIDDIEASRSTGMVLDAVENPEAARAALAEAFDAAAVTTLRVYNLGDGAAMSGILVAGHRSEAAEAACLVFLMD